MIEGAGETAGRGGWRVAALLWRRVIWRHWRRESRLTMLLVGTLALGVAVFLSVRLANKAAVSGFALFTDAVAGESDLILRPPAGSIPVTVLRELREATAGNPVSIFPVIEIDAARAGEPAGETAKIVGADFVALRNLGGAVSPQGGAPDGSPDQENAEEGRERRGSDLLLGSEEDCYVAPTLAQRWGLAPGDELPLVLDDQVVLLRVAGVLPQDPNRPAIPERLVLMDLPGAQRLAGREGELTRLEFRLPEGVLAPAFREDLIATVAGFAQERGWIVETPEQRRSSVTRMSAAFRMNLTILSGLALLVGVYLIMQAMEAAVVKRRREIAILRSLGVGRDEIRAAWLVEGAVLGVVGAAIGIVLGRLLALLFVGGVSRTVNTLYYETTTASISLGPGEILFCFAFGLLASLLAVAVPAREAAEIPPAQGLREGREGGGLALLRRPGLGLAFAGAGAAATWLPPLTLAGSGTVVPVGGYLAALALVVSASILAGLAFPAAARIVDGDSPMRRYAASQLRRPRGRHRLTTAGLAVAVGMAAAMAILVASFETALTSWIGQLLKADVYVTPAATQGAVGESTISAQTREALETRSGVAGVDLLRRYTVTLENEKVTLAGVGYHDDPARQFEMVWIDPPDLPGPESLQPGGPVAELAPAWVSEAFTRRIGGAKGAEVEVPTPDGPKALRIEGVFADYGSELGSVFVDRGLTESWFADDSITDIALYLEEGFDAEAMESFAEALRLDFPALSVRTNARLREESLRIFHQTFAVTYALELIAVIIAVSGLGLALVGLLLERSDELATLRAMGATRRELALGSMYESLGIAIAGLLAGFGLSFALGWVLIAVINPQSFGWTLLYRVPWGAFALLALLTLLAAALVGWWAGRRGGQLRSDRQNE